MFSHPHISRNLICLAFGLLVMSALPGPSAETDAAPALGADAEPVKLSAAPPAPGSPAARCLEFFLREAGERDADGKWLSENRQLRWQDRHWMFR
jgi:hypothetical protein